VVPEACATLQINLQDMDIDAHFALEGLEEYSHVWLLWAADRNGHDATQAKVRAPKLCGGKAGVFATRSPYRPNPIGLSLARLRGVTSDTLELSGVDLVSGTPIIDVKPYVPSYDMPAPDDPVRTAGWVNPPPLEVRFSPEADAELKSLLPSREETRSGATFLMSDAARFRRALEQTLAADPRPLYRWRREKRGQDSAEYDLRLDGLLVRCRYESMEGGSEYVVVLKLSLDPAAEAR
jgi:tRNA-Thr(GGU) m(6)t(6)A37 methyltransferase TsaA